MMREIRLYGVMGSRFGRSHRFDLDTGTPAEAFAALASQIPGLRKFWETAHRQGIRFAVFVGKRNLPVEHFGLPANDLIRIAPVLEGRKNGGIVNIVIGVVLILADTFIFHTGYLTSYGWGMVIGGAVQLLTPMPHGRSAKDRPENEASYNFNGPTNTQAQGNPVPLAYGDVYGGSAVISAGIDVQDNSVAVRHSAQNPKLGFGGGGYWKGGPNDQVIEVPA